MNPLVSIVVPIYNVEAYLRRCVDSIIGQTYKNLEIILVDDESPDDCPRICDEYAQRDRRVKVIHKKNGGLSDARNAGIAKATGEYVSFIDSDDYVHQSFIERLLAACIKSDADIAACGFESVKDDTAERFEATPDAVGAIKLFTSIEALRDILAPNTKLHVMTWNKLYKRNLFDKKSNLFPKGKIHEDNFTTYKYILDAQKVVYVPERLYFYMQREDSIMGRSFDTRRLDILEAVQQLEADIEARGIPVMQEKEYFHVLAVLTLMNSALFATGDNHSIVTQLRAVLRAKWGWVRKSSVVHLRHKVFVSLAVVSLPLYKLARIIQDKS